MTVPMWTIYVAIFALIFVATIALSNFPSGSLNSLTTGGLGGEERLQTCCFLNGRVCRAFDCSNECLQCFSNATSTTSTTTTTVNS